MITQSSPVSIPQQKTTKKTVSFNPDKITLIPSSKLTKQQLLQLKQKIFTLQNNVINAVEQGNEDKILTYYQKWEEMVCERYKMTDQEQIERLNTIAPIQPTFSMIYKKEKNNKIKRDVRTALHIATKNRNLSMIQFLLKNRIINAEKEQCKIYPVQNARLINAVDDLEMTPLHIAVFKTDSEIVQYLLENGADVNAQDINGNTPLHLAIKQLLSNPVDASSIISIINMLVEKTPNPYLTSNMGLTPIGLATTRKIKNKGVMDVLLAAANKYSTQQQQREAKLIAQQQQREAKLTAQQNMTLQQKQEVKKKIKERKQEVKKRIEERKQAKASGYRYRSKQKTPEQILKQSQLKEFNKYILEGTVVPKLGQILDKWEREGYDMNILLNMTIERTMTALHFAVDTANLEMINFLLDRGFDINNQKNSLSNTPLHIAVKKGLTDIVYVLLEKGANTELKNINGNTPLDLAREKQFSRIIKLLESTVLPGLQKQQQLQLQLQRHPERSNNIFEAVKNNRFDDVEHFLEYKKIDINIQDKDGRTPLHWAIVHKNNDMIKYLIQKGASLEIKDSKNNTPSLLAKHLKVTLDMATDQSGDDKNVIKEELLTCIYKYLYDDWEKHRSRFHGWWSKDKIDLKTFKRFLNLRFGRTYDTVGELNQQLIKFLETTSNLSKRKPFKKDNGAELKKALKQALQSIDKGKTPTLTCKTNSQTNSISLQGIGQKQSDSALATSTLSI